MERRIEGSHLSPEEQSEVLKEIEKVLTRGSSHGTGGFITRIRKFLGRAPREPKPELKRLIAESLGGDGAPGNSYVGLFELASGELLVANVDLEGTEASVYHGRDKETGLPKDVNEGSRTQCYIGENHRAFRSPTFLPENIRVRLGDALMKAGKAKEGSRLLKTTKLKPVGNSEGLGSTEEKKLREYVEGLEAERKAHAAEDAEELRKKKKSGEFERLWKSRPKYRQGGGNTGEPEKP